MKFYKISKKILLSIVVFILFLNISNVSYGASHWAQNEIDYLISKGIVLGYPDGTFRPNNPITRAEFVKIVNKVLNNKAKSDVFFKDVSDKDWFYDEIAKAIKSGYISGYEDITFRPNNPITREEASKIVVVAFNLENEGEKHSKFTDHDKISNWAREYVYLLFSKGYVSGYEDGTFRPDALITRAEAVKIITNISGEIINAGGEYSKSQSKNVLVNMSGVTLKDLHIPGNLYLTEGIGEGDVFLDNITVDGTVYVTGGGENSITVKNSNLNKIIVEKPNGLVHVVLDNSNISHIVAKGGTKLTAENNTLIKYAEIIGKSYIDIKKGANVDKIEVKSEDVEIIAKGCIQSLIAVEELKLNGEIIKKGMKLIIENGKIKKPDEDEETSIEYIEDDEEVDLGYKFDVTLDKREYKLNEELTLMGRVSKKNVGVENIDITLKLEEEPIFVEQLRTDKNGKFTCTFMVPEDTAPGEYKLFVKANDPVNITKSFNIVLLETDDKYNIDVKLDKSIYTKDEIISIEGTILEGTTALNDIDVSLKLHDDTGKEIVTVDQLKTDSTGSFSCNLTIPEDTNLGKYKILLKINEPVNRFLEFPIELIEG